MPRVRVGCTSWSYPDWVGPFYPAGTPSAEFLARYARAFDVVEVDATFYRLPSPEVTARWARDTPDGFTFALKLPRRITHEQRLRGVEDVTRAFLERIEPLRSAGKLGPLLAQFPPSFPRDKGADALAPFLALLPDHVRLAVEFRHASWLVEGTYDALRARGASLVWHVAPGSATPPVRTAGWVYARLVGPDRAFERFDRVQRDLRPAMRALAGRLAAEGDDAREAFVLCSNHFEGHGPGTAARMAQELGLPAPDLAAAQRPLGQRNLLEFG